MKTLLGTGLAAALLTFSVGTLADSDNWDMEKIGQMANNRCSDAGIGNDGEWVLGQKLGNCIVVPAGSEVKDTDPGNSGAHNANNNTPVIIPVP